MRRRRPDEGRRAELVRRLELWTVATVGMVRLGNPADDCYRRACEVAAELGFTDPPPPGVLVRRYMDGPWSVRAWYAPVVLGEREAGRR